MQSTESGKYARTLLAGFVLLSLLLWCTNLFLSDLNLISFVSDDAYYYLEVADRIAHGEGSTFDGINPTNGYHPLWMVVSVLARLVFLNIDKMVFVRLVLVLQAAMAMLAIWLLWKILSGSLSWTASAAGMALFMGGLFRPMTGLETALLVLALAVTAWLISKQSHPVWIGAGLALITMSRLDYAVLAGCLGLAAIWNRQVRHTQFKLSAAMSDALWVFGIPTVVGIAYMLLNVRLFGNPFPVTFLIKSAIPSNPGLSIPAAYLSRSLYLVVIVLLAISQGVLVRRGWALPILNTDLGRLGILCAVGTVAHYGYLLTVQYGAARWHMIAYGFPLAIVAALSVQSLEAPHDARPALRRSVPLMLAIGFAGVTLATNIRVAALSVSIPEDNPSVQLYEMAQWVRDNTEPDATLALADAGIVGYFSGRDVINLDGLINSHETARAMQSGMLCERMTDWAVDYLVVIRYGLDDVYAIDYTVPVWADQPTVFRLSDSAELYRTNEDRQYHVVIWAYDPAMCEGIGGTDGE